MIHWDKILTEVGIYYTIDQLWVVFIKLIIAMLLGSLLGHERERSGKAAGLRTHILVALGSTIFTMCVSLYHNSGPVDMAQVVKGIAAGLGFLGAGVIWRYEDKVVGLTTATSIWLSASVGVAVGAGFFWLALVATLLTFGVLRMDAENKNRPQK